MGSKDLGRLVGNLQSMHLAVPVTVAHLYHIQRELAQAGADKAWLSPDFHHNMADWRMFSEKTVERTTHMAEIFRRKPTHLGFCDASGLGAGGVWLDPSRSGKDLVWHHPWPSDIIVKIVSSTNRDRMITNSNLELVEIVLHEAILLAAVTDARLAAPHSGSDNTPTASWSTKEFSTINPVVAELLRLRALHLRQFFINPSVFYHPGVKNLMVDEDSCLFDLSDTALLDHMSAAYPQPKSSWKLSLLPPDLLSCVISTLGRKPRGQELHKMLARRGYTSRGATSMPP